MSDARLEANDRVNLTWPLNAKQKTWSGAMGNGERKNEQGVARIKWDDDIEPVFGIELFATLDGIGEERQRILLGVLGDQDEPELDDFLVVAVAVVLRVP